MIPSSAPPWHILRAALSPLSSNRYLATHLDQQHLARRRVASVANDAVAEGRCVPRTRQHPHYRHSAASHPAGEHCAVVQALRNPVPRSWLDADSDNAASTSLAIPWMHFRNRSAVLLARHIRSAAARAKSSSPGLRLAGQSPARLVSCTPCPCWPIGQTHRLRAFDLVLMPPPGTQQGAPRWSHTLPHIPSASAGRRKL